MSGFRLAGWGLAAVAALMLAGRASELVVVEENGDRATRINLVFLAEGYTAAEAPKFASDVEAATTSIFSREPWREYRTYCNVYRIEVASAESGCDHGDSSGPDGWRDTWFETGFHDPAVPQWIISTFIGESRAYQLLNHWLPEYDIAVILVNDTRYGGSGGPLTIVTTHPLGPAVIEHELGHSFAQLADEYDADYPELLPMEAPNTTAHTTRADIPWRHWLDDTTPLPTPETAAFAATVGLFEGSSYRASGWYRPHYDSMMRRLNQPCGAVNREQLVLNYYARVSPLDSWFPATVEQWFAGAETLAFAVTPKAPAPGGGPLLTEWLIDGEVRASGSPDFVIPSAELGDGIHELSARVRDRTSFVRHDPAGLLEDKVAWRVLLSAQPPASLATWRASYGPDLDQPAGDGLANLVKYALGLPATLPAAAADRPQASLTRLTGADYLTLSIGRRSRRQDVVYSVETSDDLVTWHSGAAATVTLRDEPTLLVVRDLLPLSGTHRRFIRLKIAAGM